MARATKGPGGGRPDRSAHDGASRRYTPPTPTEISRSSRYVPVIVACLVGLGMVLIVANYLEWLPGGTTNWWLVGGLGCFLAGILTATQWR